MNYIFFAFFLSLISCFDLYIYAQEDEVSAFHETLLKSLEDHDQEKIKTVIAAKAHLLHKQDQLGRTVLFRAIQECLTLQAEAGPGDYPEIIKFADDYYSPLISLLLTHETLFELAGRVHANSTAITIVDLMNLLHEKSTIKRILGQQEFECPLCYESFKVKDLQNLFVEFNCISHKICMNCKKDYLAAKNAKGEKKYTQCPFRCNILR